MTKRIFSCISWCIFFSLMLAVSGCKKGNSSGVNLFSIENDKQLGAQTDSLIRASPSEYPILSPTQYPEAYGFINAITNKILDGGEVFYRDEFDWEVKIIHDDNVLNAFCTPGGYIYVYTGLIKYLNAEHELAGVMGHEIAHADRRHSTTALTKQYGVSFLLSVLFGSDESAFAQVAASVIGLQFSKANESDADENSVKFLCPTDYHADGAAAFFEKLVEEGQGGGSDFFSTHPSPDKRVENIKAKKVELGCPGNQSYDARYAQFKASLPN